MAAGCTQPPAPPIHLTPETAYSGIEQHFTKGELDEAAREAEQARLAFPGTTYPQWNSIFRIELAQVDVYQGHRREAMALLEEPAAPGSPRDLLIRQHLLLGMAAARGDMALSHTSFAAAEALQPGDAMRAELEVAEGIVAVGQGQVDQAARLFQAARQDARRGDAKFIELNASLNLGFIALRREHYDEAADSFRQGSATAELLGNKLAIESALGNLGITYFRTGDFPRALESSSLAAEKAAAIGSRLDEIQWRINTGRIAFELHQPDAARASFERALALAEALHDTPKMLDAHTALASLLLHTHPDQASLHIQEAMRLAPSVQDDYQKLEPRLLQGILLAEQGNTRAAEASLLNLLGAARNAPSYQWEAESALAHLYDRTGQPAKASLYYKRAIATFHRQRLSLRTPELELSFLENGSDVYLACMEHLIRERQPDAALSILDQSRAETLAEGLGSSTVGTEAHPRELAARLHATLLVYSLRPGTSFLWAITATQQQLYTLPGSTALLPLLARHTQAILASKDLLAQRDSTGRELFDALVAPAATLIPPGGRVLLIADKDLGGLNFDTLIPPGPRPHYWIEDVTLTSGRSLRLLAAAPPAHASAGSNLLLIGNPVYHPAEFPALPNAAAEMQSIAAHFPAADRMLSEGPAASPASYAASDPARFRFLHFVAHATASETVPLDSAIILSHAGEAAPYKLYARDILGLPLHADLVTLSSCFGSGTRNYSGEGVVGLVWAFLRAGAHTVIGASWEVSDASAPRLMDSLYTALLAGQPPDEALRTAKLTLLHSDGIFRKPLYWASFQLYAGR